MAIWHITTLFVVEGHKYALLCLEHVLSWMEHVLSWMEHVLSWLEHTVVNYWACSMVNEERSVRYAFAGEQNVLYCDRIKFHDNWNIVYGDWKIYFWPFSIVLWWMVCCDCVPVWCTYHWLQCFSGNITLFIVCTLIRIVLCCSWHHCRSCRHLLLLHALHF